MLKLFQIIENIGLNRWSLMFNNKDMENQFVYDQTKNSLKLFRFSLVIALISFGAFTLLDLYYTQNWSLGETIIYTATILIIGILALYSSRKPRLFPYAQKLLSIGIGCIGANGIYYLFIDQGPFHFKNYLGIFLVFIYGFNFLKLGFFYSFIPTALTFIGYIISALFFLEYTPEEQTIYISFISFSFTIISTAGYINEAHVRNEYYLKIQLEREKRKTGEQNIILESEVEKRTIELVKMNKALTRAKFKAQGNEQLKTAFLANISHEIRTPVTKLVGFSELLCNSKLDEAKKEKYRSNIEDGANSLMQIINDLIELSKINSKDISVQKTEFKLYNLLIEIEEIAKAEVTKQSKSGVLNFTLNNATDESLNITTDKIKLRQILINFISNAVKFTPCGAVTLHCTERDDSSLEFCIEDTGIGIEEENNELIFNSFMQIDQDTNRHFGGSGLGLTINKGLIIAMGGKVWVKSEPNIGSKFYFTLPLYID